MNRRRAARIVLLALLALLAVPAALFARATVFAPTLDVPSIKTAAHYQDSGALARAWALPVAASYKAAFAYQSNGSTCGPTSVANALTSLGERQDERSVLGATGKCWSGLCLGGLTLDELSQIAAQATKRRVTVLRDLTFEDFRVHVARFNDPSRRYVINFQRAPLFAKGGGHHSPIGGWLQDRDLVLVLDVNQSFRPWLVETRRLYDAMDTVDGSSGRKRGLLLIE